MSKGKNRLLFRGGGCWLGVRYLLCMFYMGVDVLVEHVQILACCAILNWHISFFVQSPTTSVVTIVIQGLKRILTT